MASIGNFLVDWQNRRSASDKLAAVGAAPGGPPVAGSAGPAPMPLVPGTTAAPAPAAPPQPAAYQSPPDLMEMYSTLSAKTKKAQGIDNGLALMAASLAHPQNRQLIMQSVQGQPSAEDQMSTMMKLRTAQTELESKASARANLPMLAEKYGLDLNTATFLFDTGGLDNLIQEAEEPSADMKEWRVHVAEAKAAGTTPDTFKEWQAKANRSREKWGLVDKYTVDRDPTDPTKPPTIRSWVTSDMGNIKEIKDEKGNPIQVSPVKSETDTEILWTNPKTMEVVSRIDKEVYKAAMQKKEGEKEGEMVATAKAKLPTARLQVGNAIRNLDEILNDPDLDWSTGAAGIITRNTPGTPWNRVDTKIKSLEGSVFVDAYESLKGGGPITDIEGVKGTLSRAQINAQNDPEAFKKALRDARQYFVDQLSVVEATAAKGTAGADVQAKDTPTAKSQAAPVDESTPIEDIIKKYSGG